MTLAYSEKARVSTVERGRKSLPSAVVMERPAMLIQELSRQECLDFLAGTRVVRLACVHGDQAYIVPVYLTYSAETEDAPSLYGVTTLGDKVEWMRINPRVCVEVDEVAEFDQWVSVVALGRYEELADRPEEEEARPPRRPMLSTDEVPDDLNQPSEKLKAFGFLQRHAMWWEPASTVWSSRSARKPGESYNPLYYRIWIDQISGHRALPETPTDPIA